MRLPVLRHLITGLALTAVCVGACAPSTAPTQVGDPMAQPAAAPTAPKVLNLAITREVDALVEGFTGREGAEARALREIVHNTLVAQDPSSAWAPQLATESISVERGTWRIEPDGTMETTWKLRPNLKWHDGTPFTAADLLFSFEVYKEPTVGALDGQAKQLMQSISAPDPSTIVIRWSGIYVDADQAPNLMPLPRHLLEDLFRTDKDAFANSPLLTSEFVGLGPFRLTNWERGSHLDFAAFEDYHQGRPILDRVTVRVIGDPNTMIANLLSETIDMLYYQVDIPMAVEMERRWAGTTNRVLYYGDSGLTHLELQQRPELAQPRNGLPNRTVRQALYHATDRQTYNEVLNLGKPPVADSWIQPNHPQRAQLESAIPQFPFDLVRAQQLLAEAGWTRGPDGVLVHQPSGERFEIMLFATQSPAVDQQLNVLAEGWKGAGVQPSLYVLPNARATDLEHRSQLPGAGRNGFRGEGFYGGRLYLHSKVISSPANRWTGANRMGYSNPRVDMLLDRLIATISPAERIALHRELLAEAMGDVALIPLHGSVTPVLHLGSVKGVPGESVNAAVTATIARWDKVVGSR